MADSSCSHWWHAPFYLLISLFLAYISLTALHHSTPDNNNPTTTPLTTLTHTLALNASRALRTHGSFNTIATLLHISPELFINGPQSTIFALQDSAFSNLSIPPWEMRQLLHRHVSPYALSRSDLFKKPTKFCFKTMLQDKNLVITGKNAKTGSVFINNVLVSRPDMFVEGNIVVHGVSRPFDVVPSMSCGVSNRSGVFVVTNRTEPIEWGSVVRFLRLNGYVSFAIGLNAVLDGIFKDFENLGSVTIFAPPNSGLISSPSPFLERIVRLHIVGQRFSSMELAAAGELSLRTLVPNCDLKIHKLAQIMAINGVEIVAPDMFLSKKFVIHGISRALSMDKLFSSG